MTYPQPKSQVSIFPLMHPVEKKKQNKKTRQIQRSFYIKYTSVLYSMSL